MDKYRGNRGEKEDLGGVDEDGETYAYACGVLQEEMDGGGRGDELSVKDNILVRKHGPEETHHEH
jgi:hypothetical protein